MQRPRGRRAWPVGGKEEGGRSGPGAGRGDRGVRDPETGGPRGGWGGGSRELPASGEVKTALTGVLAARINGVVHFVL